MHCLRDEERGRSLRLQRREPAGVRPVRPAPRATCPARAGPQPPQHRQIAETFGPLAPMRMYARGGDGPEVTFVEAPQRSPRRGRRPDRPTARGGLATGGRRAADDWRPASGTGVAAGVSRAGRLLGDLLGQGLRVLRARAWLQGARAQGRRVVRQREDSRCHAPRNDSTSGCPGPRTSSSSSGHPSS